MNKHQIAGGLTWKGISKRERKRKMKLLAEKSLITRKKNKEILSRVEEIKEEWREDMSKSELEQLLLKIIQ